MQEKFSKTFIGDQANITDGTLTYESIDKVSLDYYEIYLGNQTLAPNKFNFVFEEKHLAVYMTGVEVDRLSYASLNLDEFDFSSTEAENLTRLSVAIKIMYERQDLIFVAENLANYFLVIADYLFIALLMAVLMSMFVNKIPMPFSARFKLSIYLSTIYAMVQLILVLFNASYLSILGMFAVYIYHTWAYRHIKIIPKGVI